MDKSQVNLSEDGKSIIYGIRNYSIYKDAVNGRCSVKLPVSRNLLNGRIRRHTYSAENEEQLLLQIRKSMRLSREEMQLSSEPYRLKAYFEKWERDVWLSYAGSTRYEHRRTFYNKVLPYFGNVFLEEITDQRIHEWAEYLKQYPDIEHDPAGTYSLLKTLLTDAGARHFIPCVPSMTDRFIKQRRIMPALSREQQEYVHQNANENMF